MTRSALTQTHRLPDFSRSEAFAEDLLEACPQDTVRQRTPRWMSVLSVLPLLVALAGLAFAVLPPA